VLYSFESQRQRADQSFPLARAGIGILIEHAAALVDDGQHIHLDPRGTGHVDEARGFEVEAFNALARGDRLRADRGAAAAGARGDPARTTIAPIPPGAYLLPAILTRRSGVGLAVAAGCLRVLGPAHLAAAGGGCRSGRQEQGHEADRGSHSSHSLHRSPRSMVRCRTALINTFAAAYARPSGQDRKIQRVRHRGRPLLRRWTFRRTKPC
jgi:hypothetical protein